MAVRHVREGEDESRGSGWGRCEMLVVAGYGTVARDESCKSRWWEMRRSEMMNSAGGGWKRMAEEQRRRKVRDWAKTAASVGRLVAGGG
ncbi:hypothetical protein AMTR_s00075p00087730 [Amborella trichopoda]|uniref:Uncharacterized protein n=1 Tax=Amborella trichopoda TaxID=13333 RepID=W1PA64_AMBTC|nr:hypothetical protein AMTR_s00075p00087730 [Amborella trichopoda]